MECNPSGTKPPWSIRLSGPRRPRHRRKLTGAARRVRWEDGRASRRADRRAGPPPYHHYELAPQQPAIHRFRPVPSG